MEDFRIEVSGKSGKTIETAMGSANDEGERRWAVDTTSQHGRRYDVGVDR